MGVGSIISMFASTARVAGCNRKSLKDGNKKSFRPMRPLRAQYSSLEAQCQQGVPGADRRRRKQCCLLISGANVRAGRDYSIEDCSELFSFFTGEQDMLAACSMPCKQL